jgi:hypothetical protein
MEDLLRIINHEAWIELDNGRAYLKWGHYPEVDGKLDPQSIIRAFAIVGRRVLPVVIGMDKESSAKGALFLEFEKADVLAVEYSRGVYTLTEDKKWIFGRNVPAKYDVKETRLILGFAKMHLSDEAELIGLELELLSDKVKTRKDEKINVQLFFRGEPVKGKIKVRNAKGVSEIDIEEDGCDIVLARGINVISARYIDETAVGVDKRSLVTTLTILAE